MGNLDDGRAVLVARMVAGEVHDVRLGTDRHIAGEREFGDQSAEGNLPPGRADSTPATS